MRENLPLRLRQSADRLFLIDQDDRIVAKGTLDQFDRFEEIERQANRRRWGEAILRMLGFTKENP